MLLPLAILAAASFVDATPRSRISFQHQASPTSRKYLPESMSSGVALLDYDSDGWMDIFFVNGAALADPMPPGRAPDKSDPRFFNRLYRNNHDGSFTDVTGRAGLRGSGYGMGVAAADYDNDGRPDLYITNYGSNLLYHNNGDGTFTDVTAKAGVAASGWSTGAAFLDYDADGFLDLVVSRYLTWDFSMDYWCGDKRPGYRSYCHPDQFQPATHLLYHNNGNGTFTDVSQASGLGAKPGKGQGIANQVYDRDGRIDILIANDSFPQQLFHNEGQGRFREVGLVQGLAYDDDGKTFAGMGVDFADYDNDGWPDVFVNALALQKYALFRNLKGIFEYVSGASGLGAVTSLHSGWGARFFDYDNDGWRDLLVGQGHVMDNIELTQPHLRYLEPLLLLHNTRGKFDDVSAQAGPVFGTPLAARGVAFGDLNNDGLVDFVVNNNNRAPLVVQNQTSGSNHWLLVHLTGSRSNRDAIGARLRLVPQTGPEQHAMVSTCSSYLSASDPRVHFGLGPSPMIRLLEISWPSGQTQRLENLRPDRLLDIQEPKQ